jgi:pimeloyl-ACP methyl ester carboxylesterase
VERFEIRVPDGVLEDLHARLARTRFPDQIPGVGWSLGTELDTLESLCRYWREEFDWREQERRLNAIPQYRVAIDGLTVHFLHVRSPHPGAWPLLVPHGWPGSILEFAKVLGPLTDPPAFGGSAADAFHVVCPSLPGYAWSEAPRERGWHPRRIAEQLGKLMARLGYERYGVQGGDWGAIIASWLGVIDAGHVAAIHINMVLGVPPPGDRSEQLSDEERSDLAALEALRSERGYQEIQGTRPQTLGYALNDSPAGLAAWIVEKFYAWSACGGDLSRSFTRDELLANVMIYWVTQSIASSLRIYYEMRHAGAQALPPRVEVPTGCAIFPAEPFRVPRRWAEQRYAVARWTRMERGGHFAALEEPELWIREVREFFRAFR